MCRSADFYEEMLALLDMFTTVSVSPQMWQMMVIIYDSFSRDGFDYFTGTTHSYIFSGCTSYMLTMQVCVRECKYTLVTFHSFNASKN